MDQGARVTAAVRLSAERQSTTLTRSAARSISRSHIRRPLERVSVLREINEGIEGLPHLSVEDRATEMVLSGVNDHSFASRSSTS
jgi:hypothetical protein